MKIRSKRNGNLLTRRECNVAINIKEKTIHLKYRNQVKS